MLYCSSQHNGDTTTTHMPVFSTCKLTQVCRALLLCATLQTHLLQRTLTRGAKAHDAAISTETTPHTPCLPPLPANVPPQNWHHHGCPSHTSHPTINCRLVQTIEMHTQALVPGNSMLLAAYTCARHPPNLASCPQGNQRCSQHTTPQGLHGTHTSLTAPLTINTGHTPLCTRSGPTCVPATPSTPPHTPALQLTAQCL
jgi:hypothetical protein